MVEWWSRGIWLIEDEKGWWLAGASETWIVEAIREGRGPFTFEEAKAIADIYGTTRLIIRKNHRGYL